MRIRHIIAAAAALGLAACNSDSSTSPKLHPNAATRDDITCRTGYHVATRSDGSQYCESDDSPAGP